MGIEYIGNIIYDEKLLMSGNKIIIFGTGIYGKRVAEYLKKRVAKDRILCFCDSDSELEDCDIMGIPVRNPIEVCKRYPNEDYLISGKFSREMYEFLKENYIDKIHILVL